MLDDNNVVSVGSRAICWAKRSLEIFDRLGIGAACVEKGVTRKVGRTHHRGRQVFTFDLLPEPGHRMPACVNLQQYYVEQFLIARCEETDLVDLRFKNRVIGLLRQVDCATLEVQTPQGDYTLEADFVIACDGARSSPRRMMDLEFEGALFEERFLIADIEMQAALPAERWFRVEPAFHSGQSAILHKQPDTIYRIDLQLGWDADPEVEAARESIVPRIERIVGHSDFRIDWTSIYSFPCRRLKNFVHERVTFAGDSADVVSPFGARGGNGGLQDVDALGWQLAAVVQDRGPSAILRSFQRRTHPWRGRKHPQFNAVHAVHVLGGRRRKVVSRRNACAGHAGRVRPADGQFGTAVGALHLSVRGA